MKKILLFITLFYGFSNALYSQEAISENGVVSFSLPIRNSLKFNRYLINPTLSFVRETNAYASFYNKRQWIQFDDAPNTYLANYSGRFRENEAFAFGLFQQNYGLMTVFGGIGNFTHNIVLQQDSNLTFGLNVGFYKSGLDQGKIISDDPNILNGGYPSNMLLTVNPGINYGTEFFDFGLSVNNLILYNFGSGIVKDDLERAIELHAMYTGYIDSYGFFDRSKFSGIVKTEIKKDKTIISGLAMLTILQGVWAQAGYNTLYGVSAGLGVNISPSIAIEYNYERGMGNFSNLGGSHEFAIAYKFKNRNYYYGDDEEGSLIDPAKSKAVMAKKTTTAPVTRVDGAEKAKLAAEAKAKADAEAQQARLAAAEKAKADAVPTARKTAVAVKPAPQKTTAQLAADKSRADAEALQAKLAAEAKAKADAETLIAKQVEEEEAKVEEEALQAKLAADAKVKADAKAEADEDAVRVRLEAQEKAKANVEVLQARLAEEADLKAKLAADAKAAKAASALKDDTAKAIESLTQSIENAGKNQNDILAQFNATVTNKQKDLDDLKEENDLSDKGIYREPRPFKSVAAENSQLEALKTQLADANRIQKDEIAKLTNLYNERLKKVPNKNDALNKAYLEKIDQLKAEQLKMEQDSAALLANLERIKAETEIEKKRRIKRAVYENDQGRYNQDVAALKRIKETTKVSSTPLTASDFDFGEDQSNMQIIKNIKNSENGYYMIIAVHSSVEKRDEFLTKAVAAGRSDVNFFYNIATSEYYIYYEKFDGLSEATKALEAKGNKPYNGKMAIVKVEN